MVLPHKDITLQGVNSIWLAMPRNVLKARDDLGPLTAEYVRVAQYVLVGFLDETESK